MEVAARTSGYRGTRFSRYTLPVLLWLAAQRVATTHQTVHRLWVLDGREGSHGYRVIGELLRRGLVERDRLEPDRGRASLSVLSLSRAGWKEVGQSAVRRPAVPLPHLLQFTQVCLLREAEGWAIVPPWSLWPELRRRALAAFRRPGLTELEREHRRRIEAAPAQRLHLWGLLHRSTGDVRIIVPVLSVGRALRVRQRLARARVLTLAGPMEIELFGGAPDLVAAARAALENGRAPRRAGGARPAGSLPAGSLCVHVAADFRTLPHPAASDIPARSAYAAVGSPPPSMLRTTSPFMATRSGGAVSP